MKKYLKKIKLVNDLYTKWKWREQKVSYGRENPDKVFYVIRRAGANVGLFSLVMTTLGYIKYALEQGYIPVVDMSNKDNTYMDNRLKGNVWEYYFEQPCGYSLEDIQRSKNIILGNGIIDGTVCYPDDSIAYNEDLLLQWKEVSDKYLVIKNDILTELDELKNKMFQGKKVLGVLLRGTDYISKRPENHPIQPTIDLAIEKIDKELKNSEYEFIYLATEDQKIYDIINKTYGDVVVSMETERYSTTKDENINEISIKNIENRYEKGKEYLINILLLAECNYLIAGNAGGSQGALLFRNYENGRFIFNLGKY